MLADVGEMGFRVKGLGIRVIRCEQNWGLGFRVFG